MERKIMKEEEVVSYTVAEFTMATRPDGKGYIFLDGEKIAEFEEVICDCCNAEIVQPEDDPEKLVVHVIANNAWCDKCLENWALPFKRLTGPNRLQDKINERRQKVKNAKLV